MSTRKAQREKDIGNIRALFRKLERSGEHIQTLLWQFMDEFAEDDEYKNEYKNDDKQYKIHNDQPSLLMDPTAQYMCNRGHTLHSSYKHLGNEPCIECSRVNAPNKPNQTQPNQQIQPFLNTYNVSTIPYGPSEKLKKDFKILQANGWDKKWPLHYAASTCNIKQIRKLCAMDTINVNKKMNDWSDFTPVDCATYYAQLPALIELLKHGADAIQTPNTQGTTPYSHAFVGKYKSITIFYQKYMNFVYNLDINSKMNRQCHFCYMFDSHYNRDNINNGMANYVYCFDCSKNNVEKIRIKKKNSEIMSARITKTLQKYPEISVDTLCRMKDVKAMDGLLKEIIVSGKSSQYTLWLLDIDNFKRINSALTHAVADTKIQAVGNILKMFEEKTEQYWKQIGLNAIWKIWCFRQGGDEFAMVVWGNHWKYEQQQQLYEMLRAEVRKIRLENVEHMEHITVSIGACVGTYMTDYAVMIKKADEMAEAVKKEGKDGIKIYWRERSPCIFKTFNDVKN